VGGIEVQCYAPKIPSSQIREVILKEMCHYFHIPAIFLSHMCNKCTLSPTVSGVDSVKAFSVLFPDNVYFPTLKVCNSQDLA